MKRTLLLGLALIGCGDTDGPGEEVSCEVVQGDGTRREALPAPEVAPCDAQGWCWESPLPFRQALGAIWHRQDQTIMTSENGHVLRLRDGVWQALPALPKPVEGLPRIFDVWAAGDTIYVAGGLGLDGVVWTWDGEAWAAEHFGTAFLPGFIYGTREREVMVVGNGGARVLEGGEWSDPNPPRTRGQGVWGCDGTYYAAMFDGLANVSRYDGEWVAPAEIPNEGVQFSAVTGTSTEDVFVGGIENGTGKSIAWHFDGAAWQDISFDDTNAVLDMAAYGPGQVLATGPSRENGIGGVWKWDGTSWTVFADVAFEEFDLATTEDILGRGALAVTQFDGVEWFEPFPLPLENPLATEDYRAIWGTEDGVLFLTTADGSVYRNDGEGWVEMDAPDAEGKEPRALWGTSADDVYLAGDRGLTWHWDGSEWSEMTFPITVSSPDLRGVWGVDADTVYAVGDGYILRANGSAWEDVESVPTDLVGIWGSGAEDIWAVGDDGRLVHYDGVTWDDFDSLPDAGAVTIQVAGIWGSAADHIVVAGGQSVWRFDGATWSGETLVTPNTLNAVFGRSAEDVYLVGQNGEAFHNDGSGWTDLHAEHSWTFHAVWGDASGLRAVGDLGTISVRP